MKTKKILKTLALLGCVIAMLGSCNDNGVGSAPSNVSGKTFSIPNTGAGTLKINFSSNSSATITNQNGVVKFGSVSYKKTGSGSAKIVVNDILIEFYDKKGEIFGRAYETDNISLIFNSDNQGVASGYWNRNVVYGTTGTTSANIDSSIFTVF